MALSLHNHCRWHAPSCRIPSIDRKYLVREIVVASRQQFGRMLFCWSAAFRRSTAELGQHSTSLQVKSVCAGSSNFQIFVQGKLVRLATRRCQSAVGLHTDWPTCCHCFVCGQVKHLSIASPGAPPPLPGRPWGIWPLYPGVGNLTMRWVTGWGTLHRLTTFCTVIFACTPLTDSYWTKLLKHIGRSLPRVGLFDHFVCPVLGSIWPPPPPHPGQIPTISCGGGGGGGGSRALDRCITFKMVLWVNKSCCLHSAWKGSKLLFFSFESATAS